MRQAICGLLTAALLLGSGGVTQAGIVFQLGNNPQPNEENVLFSSGQTGTTVTGTTNQSNSTVQFSSTIDTLVTPSSGQAKVGSTSGLVHNITMTTPGTSFTDAILNPLNGSGTATVSVVANEPGGGQSTFTFSYALGNGNNFLTITAINGESIDSVTVDAANGFEDLRQPRISGVNGVTTVPEPASMILFGFGAVSLVGYGIRRRRTIAKVS